MIDDPSSWEETEIELVLERAFEPPVDVEGFELLDAVAVAPDPTFEGLVTDAGGPRPAPNTTTKTH